MKYPKYYGLSILAILLLVQNPIAAAAGSNFSTDKQLIDVNFAVQLTDFWKKNAQESSFKSNGTVEDIDGNDKPINAADGLKIAYVKFLQPDQATEKGAIVIATGRTESYLKYDEVAYDLWHNGYSVYIIDHRGQGKSDREQGLDNPQKGYVKDFGLFVADFKQFVDEIVKKDGHRKLYLIAHSMGGAIAALYLEQNAGHPFKAAAFTSPMFELQSGIIQGDTMWATCPLSHVFAFFNPEGFVVSGTNYAPKTFDKNEYTTDSIRYNRLLTLNEREPSIRLGSPTHGWLSKACDAAESARENAESITIPVRLYQAGLDTIVHRDGQAEFCNNLPENGQERCGKGGKPIVKDGKHELLIERDEIRNDVLSALLDFFEQH